MDVNRLDALLARIDADLARTPLASLLSLGQTLTVVVPQGLAVVPVRDHETAEQQRQLGNPGPFFIADTGEVCPPRPPEPPVAQQTPTPWWRRWLLW